MRLLLISIPLSSSLSILYGGYRIGKKGSIYISILSMICNTLISIYLGIENIIEDKIYILSINKWIEIYSKKWEMIFIYDKWSIGMYILISLITLIIICFSIWYMDEDPHMNRFLILLLLFSSSMYILISGYNIIWLFVGWECVGLISYGLINFWYNSINNNKSALKAIWFNKLGDLALLYIIIMLWNNPEGDRYIYYIILIASMVKSAQIWFHCWLGDAMAGPTPVSALLHAATMVTGGIFLLIRMSTINQNPIGLNNIEDILYIIGGLTLLLGGLSSLNQYDIKKLIAYSTTAQLGLMFIALSYSNDNSYYHLYLHAFFKALLFICSGYFIHNYLYTKIYHTSPLYRLEQGLEQDIRKHTNSTYQSTYLYLNLLLGGLSLMGLIGLSGNLSKENILLSFISISIGKCILILIGSILSSLYMIKLYSYIYRNSIVLYNSSPTYLGLLYLLILLLGSIYLGYYSKDLFIPSRYYILQEYNIIYIPSYILIIILLLPLISIILYNSFSNLSYYSYVITNKVFFFDTLYNYILSYPILSLSYHLFYKSLDRGLLESIGPLGFFRILSIRSYPNSLFSSIYILYFIFSIIIFYMFIF